MSTLDDASAHNLLAQPTPVLTRGLLHRQRAQFLPRPRCCFGRWGCNAKSDHACRDRFRNRIGSCLKSIFHRIDLSEIARLQRADALREQMF